MQRGFAVGLILSGSYACASFGEPTEATESPRVGHYATPPPDAGAAGDPAVEPRLQGTIEPESPPLPGREHPADARPAESGQGRGEAAPSAAEATPPPRGPATLDDAHAPARRAEAGASRLRSSPRPDERPGLATSWGETRYSAVSEVPFERDGSSPTYTAALHYNDPEGAWALAGRGGGYRTEAAVNLGGALILSLRNEHGGSFGAYRGGGRTVAIGNRGQRYSIVLENRTNERFEVVVSVDGLDVLDGRPAGYAKRGYLIDAYGAVEIEGFRQSDEAVAAFRFGTVASSYAARTGSARDVGVIGVAAFGERGYLTRLRVYQQRVYAERMSQDEIVRRQNADPFPHRYATPPGPALIAR